MSIYEIEHVYKISFLIILRNQGFLIILQEIIHLLHVMNSMALIVLTVNSILFQ